MSRYSSSAVVSDCVLTGCSEDNRCNEHSLSSFEDYCNEATGDCICSTGYIGEVCEQSRCKCNLKVHCLFNKQLFTVLCVPVQDSNLKYHNVHKIILDICTLILDDDLRNSTAYKLVLSLYYIH